MRTDFLPSRKQHRDDHHEQRARDRRRQQRYDGSRPAPENPADAGAEGQQVGARRQSAERKRERKLLLAHPSAFADDLAMDDRGGGAAAAEREVGVASKDVRDLQEGRA